MANEGSYKGGVKTVSLAGGRGSNASKDVFNPGFKKSNQDGFSNERGPISNQSVKLNLSSPTRTNNRGNTKEMFGSPKGSGK